MTPQDLKNINIGSRKRPGSSTNQKHSANNAKRNSSNARELQKLSKVEETEGKAKIDHPEKHFLKYMIKERNLRKLTREKVALLAKVNKRDYIEYEKGTAKRNVGFEKKLREYFDKNPPKEESDDE